MQSLDGAAADVPGLVHLGSAGGDPVEGCLTSSDPSAHRSLYLGLRLGLLLRLLQFRLLQFLLFLQIQSRFRFPRFESRFHLRLPLLLCEQVEDFQRQ